MTGYRKAAISAEDICQYLATADAMQGIDEGATARSERHARAEFVKLAAALGYAVAPLVAA